MAVARVNLYIQGIIRLIKSPAHPGTDSKRVPEIIALCVFFTWMTCLVRCIDGGANKAMFLFVSHALAGILHVQITLSHFACEVMSEAELGSPDTARDDTVYGGDFYTRSIKSSLDVDCHPWMDWFHGGLQFQVIHHCFPVSSLPACSYTYNCT
jgi:delta8-fatty-acid desaturase